MTTPTEGFPAHLLTQPAADRLAYFTTKMVGHPRLKEVHQAVMQAMRQSAGAALFFVFGPTGVGKTTLRQRIEQQVLAEFLPTHAAQPGRVPIVGIEALAPESGSFNWKDYYMRALRALHEPLVTDKIDYGIRGMRHNSAGQLVIGPSVVVAELRQALEQSLRHRQPTAVLIDEAQHLKKMTSGRRLLDQMDTLKSLASTTQTLHILIGTYEVLGLTHLSGQLSRRSSEIHFARYRFDDPADRQMFLRVVYTFQRHLPLADEPDLVSRAEYLYERCVGCVGVLKTWLTQALAAALAEDAPTLTQPLLERWVLPTRNLLRMAREIADGEALLRERDEQAGDLRTFLGMDATPGASLSRGRPSARSARPVGQRKPTRDPVGEVPHDI